MAAQDTTEINFSGRDRGRKGLGPAGDGKTPGFFCHGMVAIDVDDEALLGVLHARIWTRPSTPATARRGRAIEDKESIRWIEATAVAGNLLGTATQLIVLGDREFDIYSQFVRVPRGVELIVRAAQNRKLGDADELLFSAPSDWCEIGAMEVRVPPHRPGEAARTARVDVKAGRVCIARPRHGADRADPPTVTLTFVEVRETNPPEGHDPIVWRLLTTLPVCGQADEFAAAHEVVQLYRLRWRIEQVFRAMKSDGLRLEETQVQEASRLFKLAAIAFTAAARTIQLVDARDGSPRPASDVADEDLITAAEAIGPTLEGRTERQKIHIRHARSLGSPGSSPVSVAGIVTTSRRVQRPCEPAGPNLPTERKAMLLQWLGKMHKSRRANPPGDYGRRGLCKPALARLNLLVGAQDFERTITLGEHGREFIWEGHLKGELMMNWKIDEADIRPVKIRSGARRNYDTLVDIQVGPIMIKNVSVVDDHYSTAKAYLPNDVEIEDESLRDRILLTAQAEHYGVYEAMSSQEREEQAEMGPQEEAATSRQEK